MLPAGRASVSSQPTGLKSSAAVRRGATHKNATSKQGVVHISVTGITGETVAECDIPLSMTIAAVKQSVFEASGVPAVEQRLLPSCGGMGFLRDNQCVGDMAGVEAGGTCELSLVRCEGRLAISWSADRTICLWDLESGAAVHNFGGHTGSTQLRGVEVCWEQGLALTWSREKMMRVWDINHGVVLQNLACPGSELLGVLMDWERSRALTWARDRVLRVWNLQTGMDTELRGHSTTIKGVQPGWAQNCALSWSIEDAILWDIELGTASRSFRDMPGLRVCAVDSHWRGALIGSRGSSVYFWDFKVEETELWGGHATVVEHESGAPEVSISWDSLQGISWNPGVDDTLQLWDMRGSCVTRQVPGIFAVDVEWERSLAVSWSIDENMLMAQLWEIGGTADPHLNFVGGGSGYPWRESGNGVRTQVDWERRRAISWNDGGLVLQVWVLEQGSVALDLWGHTGKVQGVQVDWTNDRALTWSGQDTTLRLWDITNGQVVFEMLRDPCGFFGVHVDWKRNCALTWTEEGWGNIEFPIELWDLDTGNASQVLNGHADVILGSAMAPPRERFSDTAKTANSNGSLPNGISMRPADNKAAAIDYNLFASYVNGDLDNLIAEYRGVLRANPARPARRWHLNSDGLYDGPLRTSGEGSGCQIFVPTEEMPGRVRLLMAGDANVLGAPYSNAAPAAAAVAKMNDAVMVENNGGPGLLSMMLAAPQDYLSNTGRCLPRPKLSDQKSEYACILIGTLDAICIAGTDSVVNVMCVGEQAPVALPLDWDQTCRPCVELYEKSLRDAVQQLLATGARVAIATPPPLGEEVADTSPMGRLLRRSPFAVVSELALAVRRVAASEQCVVLPLFECCIHRLRQLEKSGRRLVPWRPKDFWDRQKESQQYLFGAQRQKPFEDLFPGTALCTDLVKLNESGAAIFAALVQSWLDFQMGTNEVPDEATSAGLPPLLQHTESSVWGTHCQAPEEAEVF
eukprot:TRINITY_DN27796_c0_g1_i1.p1 TRINITY_DN27796_c0_g1~~TRINITY_DN27796_c0_g1_i1.p1  ORF type:complete len:973 (+),score=168.11 TRINITY_DN27796_c0_g1_i1:204-3122(+)